MKEKLLEMGHTYIGTVGRNRYITLAEFEGKKYVHFREWFDTHGKLLPSKKGICIEAGEVKKVVELLERV